MPLNIKLTPEIRSLAYFSNFQEDEVEVPDKPFLRQLLDGNLSPEALSPADLSQAIETCIYFALETDKPVQELLWKVGSDLYVFKEWFVKQEKDDWVLNDKLPAVIRAELTKIYGSNFTRKDLVKLGLRCPNPTCLEIMGQGNLRLLKWAHEQAEIFDDEFFWDEYACMAAARGGHLDCLRYAYEQGFPCGKRIRDKYGLEQHQS